MPSQAMIQVDCIIHARWIIPVVPTGVVLNNYSLVITNNRIIDLLRTAKARRQYKAKKAHNLKTHALIPGLINAHGHAAMTLFRGMADDLPLMTWLNNHIWPAESRWVGDSFVETGTELAIAEMLLSGTTCFSDMYYFPNRAAKIVHRHKIRAQIFVPILDFPSAWAVDADQYFHKGLKVVDDFRNHDLINIGFGPHAPYTVCNAALQRVSVLADELDAIIQIHLHETKDEIDQAIQQTGRRPIVRLDEIDFLSPRVQCVHTTQIIDEDIELLKNNGCHVIHCPESNLKLAAGFCPTTKLVDAGINVALGTDGAASNNDLDMFGEMQTAALLAKGLTRNASALPAAEALRMATLNGAKALGLDAIIGSLEIGKAADITAINLGNLMHQPTYDPISQLVYTACARDVSHVWVDGRLLVDKGKLTQLDTVGLTHKVQEWRAKISAAENQQTLKF
jgi:5-methylthioadenosine/S-adenosylhomocysteine deaminase